MKKILLLLFCLPLLTIGQVNLVPNPSFEDTVVVQLSPTFVSNALYWYSPNSSSPDYVNANYGGSWINSINHTARTGKAFVGLVTSHTTTNMNYREYVQVKLNQPLISGKEYAVGYYYSLSNLLSSSISNCLGFRFSYDTLAYPSWFTTPPATYYNHLGTNSLSYMDTNLALLTAMSIGGDTFAWYPLQTTYIAAGGEEYLTFGNLYGVDSTNLIYVSTPINPISQTNSYFFIDDVYVLDIEQLQDTDLVYIDTFNMGVPVTYNCIENTCIDPGDATGMYTTLADCQAVCGVSIIEENNTTKQLLKITDVFGRKSKLKSNTPLFYRYIDGTVEKRIIVE